MFACLLLIVVPKPNIGNGRPHPPITTPLHPSLSVHMPIRDPNQCCVADNNNNKKKLNRKNRREGFGYNKKKTRDSEIGDRPLFITAKAFPLLSFLFVARLFVISTSAFTKKCVSSFFMCLRASHDRIMPLFVVRAFLCAFFFFIIILLLHSSTYSMFFLWLQLNTEFGLLKSLLRPMIRNSQDIYLPHRRIQTSHDVWPNGREEI